MGQKSYEFSSLLFTVTSTNGVYYAARDNLRVKKVEAKCGLTLKKDYAQKLQRNCRFLNSASVSARTMNQRGVHLYRYFSYEIVVPVKVPSKTRPPLSKIGLKLVCNMKTSSLRALKIMPRNLNEIVG